MRICKNCGKEFNPEYPNQVFCNFFCRKEYRSKEQGTRYQLMKDNPKYQTKHTCKNCGKEFITHGANKYCSKECVREYRNKVRRKPENERKYNKSVKKEKPKRVHKPSTTRRMVGFVIKFPEINGGFMWEAYKDGKLVLKSAEVFSTYYVCLRDARLAFRG
jgi:hypothetical protein